MNNQDTKFINPLMDEQKLHHTKAQRPDSQNKYFKYNNFNSVSNQNILEQFPKHTCIEHDHLNSFYLACTETRIASSYHLFDIKNQGCPRCRICRTMKYIRPLQILTVTTHSYLYFVRAVCYVGAFDNLKIWSLKFTTVMFFVHSGMLLKRFMYRYSLYLIFYLDLAVYHRKSVIHFVSQILKLTLIFLEGKII